MDELSYSPNLSPAKHSCIMHMVISCSFIIVCIAIYLAVDLNYNPNIVTVTNNSLFSLQGAGGQLTSIN